ncbi:hypothetical protein WH47_02779 [Habropoda laboriosa]|uniref:Uncharacterized protein n=1 Tax=Habropoda laboriosa TaxID=597456 RepID=A0A0L7QXD6_9HYME|nr:hypothetical protein WH47_02779 [Habropoda laboriosa]
MQMNVKQLFGTFRKMRQTNVSTRVIKREPQVHEWSNLSDGQEICTYMIELENGGVQ